MSRSTLEVAAQIVVTAEGGALDVEYALFDAGDIQLQSSGPGTNREAGYVTTAAKAQSRLADHGVTPDLGREAAAALAPIACAYARGPAVRRIVESLGPAELFEGQAFEPGTGLYRGAWLDLPDLAADLNISNGPALLQALHLAAILSERPRDELVVLSTAEVTAVRRPGERTFRRVELEQVHELVSLIVALGPASRRPRASSGPNRHQVVERLRERADRAPAMRAILPALEAALIEREQPSQGPLADPELWAIDVRVSRGDTHGVLDDLDRLEKRRGRLPGTTYLRARAELSLHTENPRDIAERISAMSTAMTAFHELELLAAQAWTAAGDWKRAKAFARDLLDNRAAIEPLRLQARLMLEELESIGTNVPGPMGPPSGSAPPQIPREPRAPSGLEMDPSPFTRSPPPKQPTRPAPPHSMGPAALATRATDRAPPYGGDYLSAPFPSAYPHEVERLDSLSVPAGLQGMPPPDLDEPPRSPPAARLTFTFLARELGRDLRARHGVELHTDLDGLEIAQRYLRERLPEGRLRTREDERELMRHGAFLSELLARRLGAHWAELSSNDPARWAMRIPEPPLDRREDEPSPLWPFARVIRFIAVGHKERDLVSYVLELAARSRHP